MILLIFTLRYYDFSKTHYYYCWISFKATKLTQLSEQTLFRQQFFLLNQKQLPIFWFLKMVNIFVLIKGEKYFIMNISTKARFKFKNNSSFIFLRWIYKGITIRTKFKISFEFNFIIRIWKKQGFQIDSRCYCCSKFRFIKFIFDTL